MFSFNPHDEIQGIYYCLHLYIWKLKLREVMLPLWGHSACSSPECSQAWTKTSQNTTLASLAQRP